jgi:hypothetical protein
MHRRGASQPSTPCTRRCAYRCAKRVLYCSAHVVRAAKCARTAHEVTAPPGRVVLCTDDESEASVPMLTYWLTRATAPIAFATTARTARHLFGFARAEHESMLELRAAAAASAAPERAAAYLRHALDEQRHTAMFCLHAAELGTSVGLPGFGAPVTGCDGLFAHLGERGFLAFVHRGERHACEQFAAYRDYFAARRQDKLRALFSALIVDEMEHANYTLRLLAQDAAEQPARPSGAAARALRHAAIGAAWRRFRRAGQALTLHLYNALMMVLYVLLLPLAIRNAISPSARGWKR